MEAQELRSLSLEELNAKVKGWREELFRAKIRFNTSEIKDTSQFRKLKKDIARGLLVLGEMNRGVVPKTAAPEDKPVSAKPADKGKAKKTVKKKSKKQ